MRLPLDIVERVVERILSPSSLHRGFSSCARASAASDGGSSSSHSYSDTIILPKTSFPLRANAVTREPLFRRRTTTDLYTWQLAQTDRPLFILHDGPPYANGQLHTGHFMNKTLKDIINRSKVLQGHRVHYVPGYDTHGLPLELKALETMKSRRGNLSPQEVRAQARKEAEKGIEIQSKEFSEFGGMGSFDPSEAYKTLDWSYEKRQLRIFKEMVRKDLITTHHRPTLYSPSSKTALAEAEIEYREDHISRSVYVGYPVAELGELSQITEVAGETISLAVWTTTPWTLPANVAIAVSNDMEYTLARNSRDGQLIMVASLRLSALEDVLSSATFPVVLTPIAVFPGSTLLSTTYSSPLSSPCLTRPIMTASYVTSTTGTGLVHTAPAHGGEDWEAWRSYRAQTPYRFFSGAGGDEDLCVVDEVGKYNDALGRTVDPDCFERLVGMDVLKEGTKVVVEILEERGVLLRAVDVEHKYPYDWRTKKPVIFRASSQWFANLEKIKDDAINSLEAVDFFPAKGRKAMEIFVRGRSEWCISRQRPWGVPLPVVYSYPASASSLDPASFSTPYLTPSNIEHIISVLDSKAQGTDYWWEGSAEEFVEPAELERSRAEGLLWRKGTDTMDVWFDSGVSWSFIKELGLRPTGAKEDLPIADVYLEGGDQYRGWFQSGLLTAIASGEGENPKAPFGTIITHGMVLDEQGRKMSKSLGNVISPLSVIHGDKSMPAFGVDLLRLWVASVDSTRDVPIGRGILDQIFESLRKIRNTSRFLLGSLANEPVETTPPPLGLIERYIMNELYLLDQTAREGYNTFAFNKVYHGLITFSNSTLSSFYFNVAKDSLYADSKASVNRRAIIFTLQKILETYTLILAPIAPHLAEEIHHFSKGAAADPKIGEAGSGSIFEKVWEPVDARWRDEVAKSEMESLFVIREEVLALLEQARKAKFLRGSAEAEVVITNGDDIISKHHAILKTLFTVSDVHLDASTDFSDSVKWKFTGKLASGVTVTVLPTSQHKCPRCWLHTRKEEEDVCGRCKEVLK